MVNSFSVSPDKFVLVRDWDCKNFRIISLEEKNEIEGRSKTSAFAESRLITKDRQVHGTPFSVEDFLAYRNG